jgi:hypothetical protein
MSDFATLTTGPVLCPRCQDAVANAFEAHGDDTAATEGRTLFATTFRSICESDLQYWAEDLRDELRFTACHPVRMVLIPEIDPVVSLDAEPYGAEERAAVEAQKTKEAEIRAATFRSIVAHRAAVLAEAAREEPLGPIPLDDFLGG